MRDAEVKKSFSLKDIFSGKFFSWDGRFMGILNGFGELIMLSVVFLVCCIPIVTIGPAVTSLYYAVIKSVRRGRGTPLGEFFSSMKRTMGKGILITVEIIAVGAALYIGYRQAVAMNEAAAEGLTVHDGKVFATVYIILAILLAAMTVYFSGYGSGCYRNGSTCMDSDLYTSDSVCSICSRMLVLRGDIYDGEGFTALYAKAR